MKEFKLIVAGGRDFDDAEHLSRVLFAMADVEFADYEVSIVSGMARGADALGYQFAKANGVKTYEFPADWGLGKHAGFLRNEAMAKFSDGLLCFWDEKSKGSKHMIETMRRLNKPMTVIKY